MCGTSFETRLRGNSACVFGNGAAADGQRRTYQEADDAMNDKIAIAAMNAVVTLMVPVQQALLAKEANWGVIVVWVIVWSSVMGVFFFIFREEKRSQKARPTVGRKQSAKVVTQPEKTVKPQKATATDSRVSHQSIRRGFMLVMLAALCWSVSNILLRITASKLPSSGLDIALINYLVAAVFLILAAWVVCRVNGQLFQMPPMQSLATFWLVAAAKGINTYTWILAVTLISAASAATLEGLHVVFTVALLLALRVQAPKGSWMNSLASSAILVVGVVLILGLPVAGDELVSWVGILLGVVSAFSFSVFYVLWQRTGVRSAAAGPRTLEMGVLLLAAAFCLFPIHLAVSALWGSASLAPVGAMDWGDIGLQVICGLIGIGATYFLINESLHYMKSHKLCSLLLGIGLSYSVPFTMILETLFLGLTPRLEQWLGALLFAVAFAAIFRDIREAQVVPVREVSTG